MIFPSNIEGHLNKFEPKVGYVIETCGSHPPHAISSTFFYVTTQGIKESVAAQLVASILGGADLCAFVWHAIACAHDVFTIFEKIAIFVAGNIVWVTLSNRHVDKDERKGLEKILSNTNVFLLEIQALFQKINHSLVGPFLLTGFASRRDRPKQSERRCAAMIGEMILCMSLDENRLETVKRRFRISSNGSTRLRRFDPVPTPHVVIDMPTST